MSKTVIASAAKTFFRLTVIAITPRREKQSLTNIGIASSFLLAMTFLFQSCVSVKEYQKMYINDSQMQLSLQKTEVPEMHFMLYREGASGANGGKTGGGCGCN